MRVTGPRGGAMVLALLLLGGTVAAALIYPLGTVWLIFALTVYAALLWRYPRLALPVILVSLPLLDFAPASGWVLLDEFDFLVAVTLAVRLLRPPAEGIGPDPATPGLSRGAKWSTGCVAASFLVSALIGLLPLPPFRADALFTYYTGFNSLREVKGFVWALALLPLLAAESRQPERLERHWMAGMLLGLCGAVAVILWQRAVFTGLLDFGAVYRVEGTFPELHTGGGDVHAYLVMAIPFVAAWVVQAPTLPRIATGATLFVLASYALGVTFTRGAYVGYFGALAVMAVAIARNYSTQRGRSLERSASVAVLAVTGLAVLAPILSGSFMVARLAGTQAEAGTRARHWAQALEMMDKGLATALFGMGLGTFPTTFLFNTHGAASATFSYQRENGNGFVRLGSGRPLYLDQRVPVAAGKRYTLALDMRSPDPQAKVYAMLCEKSVQYSFRCKEARFERGAGATGWEHREAQLDSGQIGAGPWPLRRPVNLSIANLRSRSIVDVDNVRLVDESGHDLVVNGDFSRGGARWFFSADDHLPWHIFSLWVQVLFEQGWSGVIALLVALVISLRRLTLGLWRGDWFSSTLLAALGGFLLVGLTESLFDGPRITTLFFLLLFAGMLRAPAAAPA